MKLARQVHVKLLPETMHVAPFLQGADEQGVIGPPTGGGGGGKISQVLPDKPPGHEQVNELPFTLHVPPFWHGFDEHGVISQSLPEKPRGQ